MSISFPVPRTASALTLAASLSLILAACSKAPEAPAPAPEVAVVAASPQDVRLVRQMVGRLSAYRSADVRARVPGILRERLYQEGTDVSADQPLFRIDPAPLQAALARAQGELDAARAGSLNAKSAADRARTLAPRKFVSRADLDAAEAAERTAVAAVSQAQALVTSARIDLGYATVRAPIQGRASKQQVTEGALVGSSDATLLTTVEQIDPLYVNLSISSAELETLRDAQAAGAVNLSDTREVNVRVIKADGTPYAHLATLDFAGMEVDASSGAVSLRAVLPNPDRSLLPGSFVTVETDLGNRSNAFLIPQQAVQRDTAGAFVMVAQRDGVVARKDIQIEPRAVQGRWVVTKGLTADDQVIALGLQSARVGTQVRTVAFQPEPAPASAPDAAPANGPAQN